MKKIQGSHIKNLIGQLFRWLDERPDDAIGFTWYGKIRAVVVSRKKYEELTGEKIIDDH
jgi:hypothetical protein